MVRTILNNVDVIETGEEPVLLDLTKLYLGIASTVHDTLLSSLITIARLEVEHYCKKKLIESTIVAYFESINEYTYLPYTPVLSITSVNDAEESVLTYEASKGSNPKIKIHSNKEVIITYDCGLNINEDLKLCIIKKVGEDFEFRTGISITNNSILPNNWRSTALKHRNTWLM